jgi:UDP-N-acetylglucosamine 1-carboxyvinyltransferase
MSQMHENVWDNRFQYVPELQSMGASISVMERIALVHGPVKFSGARVTALDLRAGAAMVLAGLAAEGTTTIGFANRIERGYEKIVEKLRGIGAEIEHIEEDEEHVLPVDDE